MRDFYGRRRITRDELMNPTGGNVPVASVPFVMPANPMAASPMPAAAPQIQRPVFERQLGQVARPDFTNIISMLQKRRRLPPQV